MAREIKKGAYGMVYLEPLDNGDYVACKYLITPPNDGVLNPQEIDIFCRIDHPNICHSLNFGRKYAPNTSDFQTYIMMAYAQETLTSFIHFNNSKLTLSAKLDIIHQILAAVDFLHQQQIIHLDLKTDNILIYQDPTNKISGIRAVVTDFGSCQYTATSLERFLVQTVVTLDVRPNENINNPDKNYKFRHSQMTDVWSLGLIILHILSGERFHKINLDNEFTENAVYELNNRYFDDKVRRSNLSLQLEFVFRGHDQSMKAEIITILDNMLNLNEHKRKSLKEILNFNVFKCRRAIDGTIINPNENCLQESYINLLTVEPQVKNRYLGFIKYIESEKNSPKSEEIKLNERMHYCNTISFELIDNLITNLTVNHFMALSELYAVFLIYDQSVRSETLCLAATIFWRYLLVKFTNDVAKLRLLASVCYWIAYKMIEPKTVTLSEIYNILYYGSSKLNSSSDIEQLINQGLELEINVMIVLHGILYPKTIINSFTNSYLYVKSIDLYLQPLDFFTVHKSYDQLDYDKWFKQNRSDNFSFSSATGRYLSDINQFLKFDCYNDCKGMKDYISQIQIRALTSYEIFNKQKKDVKFAMTRSGVVNNSAALSSSFPNSVALSSSVANFNSTIIGVKKAINNNFNIISEPMKPNSIGISKIPPISGLSMKK